MGTLGTRSASAQPQAAANAARGPLALLLGLRPRTAINADTAVSPFAEGQDNTASRAALRYQGSLIFPPPMPGGSPPVKLGVLPGNTMDEEACRRSSCSSLTARSTPSLAASPYFNTASPRLFASMSKLIGSGPMLVRI